MDHREFFKAVVDMRHFQKEYEREPAAKSEAIKKLFETQIDTEIERVFKVLGIRSAEELTIEKMKKK